MDADALIGEVYTATRKVEDLRHTLWTDPSKNQQDWAFAKSLEVGTIPLLEMLIEQMKWLADECCAEIDQNDTGEDDSYGRQLRRLHIVAIKTVNNVLNSRVSS